MAAVGYILAAIGGYLLGSVPTGYLVGRARGVDLRTAGSGNIGATNVLRTLGKSAGALVLAADVAKGFLGCWLVPRLLLKLLEPSGADPAVLLERWAMTGGVAAILGHNYTCWLRFRGGKGVATTAGVLLALFPKAFLIALGVWLVVLGVSRYVSLASMAAAAALPLAVWLSGGSRPLIALSGLLGLLAIYRHRGNFQRLLRGTEHRLGQRPADASPGAGSPASTNAPDPARKQTP